MDMALFDTKTPSETGVWLEPLDMDWTTKIGCSILVMGPDAAEATQITDEEDRLAQAKLVAAFSGTKDPTVVVEESKTEKEVRKAVRLTKDWKDIEWNGQSFPYSSENAKKLYTHVPHIRMQVITLYGDRLNFTAPGYASWKAQSGLASSSTTPEKKEHYVPTLKRKKG